jgi:xanthine dehydrogenase/oxidase
MLLLLSLSDIRSKVDLAPHEILKSVFLPFTRMFEYVKEFKQAHRREDDIAIVTACIRMRLELADGAWKVPGKNPWVGRRTF